MNYQHLFPLPQGWIQPEDEVFAAAVAEWAAHEVTAGRLEHHEDYRRLLEPAMNRLMVDIGLQALLVPEEYGGSGVSGPGAPVTACVVLEQASIADTGIGFVCANTFALQYACFSVNEMEPEAAGRVAGIFCGDRMAPGSMVLPGYGRVDDEGSRTGVGPGTGTGVSSIPVAGLESQVSLHETDGKMVLNGKCVRPQCSGATAALLGLCFLDRSGLPGIALVEPSSAGFSAGRPFLKTGLAASINADLVLDRVEVLAEMVAVRRPGDYRRVLSLYYLFCAASVMGAMIACYGILKEWGDTRVIKGRNSLFRNNPLVAALMGRIGCRITTSRILVYSLASMLGSGCGEVEPVFSAACSVVRTVLDDAMDSIDYSMELMASAGYATEWNLERYWRDVKTIQSVVVPETVAEIDIAAHLFGSEVR